MMAFTHVVVSLFLFTILTPEYISTNTLPFFIIGALLPDLDMKGQHRKTFHFPFLYPVFAFVSLWLSSEIFFTIFLSAGVHCLMEILGNDADDFVEAEKGAVYDHLRKKWIPGFYWIKQDGGFRDLMLLIIVSILVVILKPTKLIILITVFSVVSGLVYYSIRDNVENLFPEFMLR